MSDELANWVALIVAILIIAVMLTGAVNLGTAVENNRLYRKCLVEQQDRTHKEAVELCRERTKE